MRFAMKDQKTLAYINLFGILGALAAQLGTALFTGLLLGVVITRDVIEFVRVPFERGKA